MRQLIVTICAFCMAALLATSAAAQCKREDFAKAVDAAGASLRRINAENTPRLKDKMRQLKSKMRWPEVGYEEKAYEVLQDERIAAYDAGANDLLARVDALGTVDPSAEPDCAKLQELAAVSLELQATVKAKSAYVVSKLEQMLGETPVEQPKAKTPDKSAEVKAAPPPPPPKTAAQQPVGSDWSAKATGKAAADPPRGVAIAPPPAPPPQPPAPASLPPGNVNPPEEEGYTIDEIRVASAGFFGQLSANLGSVIEHVFRKSGRPTGYVLGTEGGGAFLAGVRYGKGKLYMRSGATQEIFWHGPTLGADVGGEGSKTLFLIYKLGAPEQLYSSFTGVDGSAYLVGGVGATLVTNGSVVMAPIRSGIGLRLGANIGYIRFTPKATWNPF
jgi:hypothetical protein